MKDKPKKKEKEELAKGNAFDKEKFKKPASEKSKSIEFNALSWILLFFLENKFTEEGYRVYSVEDLNIGKGKLLKYNIEN